MYALFIQFECYRNTKVIIIGNYKIVNNNLV